VAVLRVVSLVFAVLVVGASSLFGQSDPMAKWKPNVGDRFYFRETFDGNVDTAIITIIATDSTLDSLGGSKFGSPQHGVVVSQRTMILPSGDTVSGLEYYQFDSSGYKHSNTPFRIWCLYTLLTERFSPWEVYPLFNFDSAEERVVQIQNVSSHGLYARDETPSGPTSYYFASVIYSLSIKWFLNMHVIYDWMVEKADRTLMYSLSSVRSSPKTNALISDLLNTGSEISIYMRLHDFPYVYLFLLDPLGRPIRTWQMPVEAGEQQITLNVADVPSGVYFLRVSGGGVDEVKRVAIVH